MKQNITLSLDKRLIQQIKILAAQKSTSISALLSESLEELVRKNDRYEQAKQRALRSLARGYHMGGNPAKREDLYDR